MSLYQNYVSTVRLLICCCPSQLIAITHASSNTTTAMYITSTAVTRRNLVKLRNCACTYYVIHFTSNTARVRDDFVAMDLPDSRKRIHGLHMTGGKHTTCKTITTTVRSQLQLNALSAHAQTKLHVLIITIPEGKCILRSSCNRGSRVFTGHKPGQLQTS